MHDRLRFESENHILDNIEIKILEQNSTKGKMGDAESMEIHIRSKSHHLEEILR